MATAGKKASKKRKAKKVRKSPPTRASKKAAAKKRAAKSKRVVKKAGKASKKAAKKVAKKSPKKAAKKVAKKPAKKSAKKSTRKSAKKSCEATSKKRAVAPKTEPAVDAMPAAETPKAVAPRAKPAAAAKPAAVAERNTYFVTTPIFYPNGIPHIGHAYTAMVTDAIARFQRLDGFDVRFLTGTDEHGLKMQQTAVAEGLTPLALADRNSARFREMMTALNISYDDYIRTTEPRHERACQALWRASRRTAISISANMQAGIRSVRRLISTKRKPPSGLTVSAANRWARRSSGPRRKPISFACRPIRTNCSPSMRMCPTSCCRASGSMKLRVLSKAA